MSLINRFEDIEVWRKARDLSKNIYQITSKGKLNIDYSLKDQMRRSSGSIMDNIAEGYERNGIKQFRQFLSISKGSAAELKSQLYRCFDQKYLDKIMFNELYNKIEEISKMLSGFIRYLNVSGYKGFKFK